MAHLCQFPRFVGCFLLACLALTTAMTTATSQTSERPSWTDGNFERCRAITDNAARLRCYEAATSKPGAGTTRAPSTDIGSWRLVRTPNPQGGREAVSIMQTADLTKSDIDFAGVMLRCGESHVEVLVVLVRPLPPHAHPKVITRADGKSATFIAAIVPPGAAVVLPAEASQLASDSWKAAPELSLRITVDGADQQTVVNGVISLVGLSEALPLLLANCPSP